MTMLPRGVCMVLVVGVMAGLTGCGVLDDEDATESNSSRGHIERSTPREPSRCGACGGSGRTKDYNRGVMEVCYYCNGRGVY